MPGFTSEAKWLRYARSHLQPSAADSVPGNPTAASYRAVMTCLMRV